MCLPMIELTHVHQSIMCPQGVGLVSAYGVVLTFSTQLPHSLTHELKTLAGYVYAELFFTEHLIEEFYGTFCELFCCARDCICIYSII